MAHQTKPSRVIKAQRTKIRNQIDEKLQTAKQLLSTQVVPETAEETIQEADVINSFLRQTVTRFEAICNELIGSMEEPTDQVLQTEVDDMEDMVGKVTETCTRLTVKVQQVQVLLKPNTSRNSDQNPADLANLENKIERLIHLQTLQSDLGPQVLDTTYHRSSVRLPKLEIDKFGGDVLEFKEFWDHFAVAIHSNQHLQPVEKLNYLRTYLKGEAKQVIAGLTAIDENYEVAVNLLQTRYGNTQASIDAHYSKLMEIPVVPFQTSKLRAFIDKVVSHLRCLQALGEDIEHRHFISLIMSKLPRDLVAHLEEVKGSDVAWSVDLLRKRLHNLLSAREIAERQNGQTISHSTGRNFHNSPADERTTTTPKKMDSSRFNSSFHSSTGRSTTETLIASEKKTLIRRPTGPCVFCGGGNHFHVECRTISTLEKRRQKLRESKRCFNCLRQGHCIKDCRSSKACYYCKKTKGHHQSICPTKFSSKDSAALATDHSPSASSVPQHPREAENTTLSTGETALLQTASLSVKNPASSLRATARALLDCGSSRTYITAEMAKRLKLQSQDSEHFSIGTFGSQKRKTVCSPVTQLQIKLKDGSYKTLDVNVIDKITGPVTRMPVEVDFSSIYDKIAKLELADPLPTMVERSKIDLLIGSDYYLDIINTERLEVKRGLYLLDSKHGWLLTGRVEIDLASRNEVTMFVDSRINTITHQVQAQFSPVKLDEETPVKPNMQDLWDLESIGIKDNSEVTDDDRAIEAFNSTVKVSDDGRYEVAWPWIDKDPDLPDNYQLSLGRFKALVKKFKANPELFCKYRDVIKEQERLGIIEKVRHDSAQNRLKHYIPHHPVVTPGKATTKVRIVYDAPAKVRKTALSLNQCLLRGPVLLEDLCGLLLRFRIHNVAIISDIEKAFLQIGLQEPDRDVTRFFWFKYDVKPEVDNNLQLYRFCRVPFGMISSPFLLGATIKFHLANQIKEDDITIARQIQDGLYVDNVITGCSSKQEALKFYERAKTIFNTASMNLREWSSNCNDFLEQIPENDRATSEVVKVLGILWDTNKDKIFIHTGSSEKMIQASTKRHILQMIATVFDPLGLFAPITLKAKLLLRKMWEKEKDWDDALDDGIIEEWRAVSRDLTEISKHHFDRSVLGRDCSVNDVIEFHLICFSDASISAYASAIYLKIVTTAASYVSLIFAKTRLSPAKKISIPRLELLATMIGVRCLNFVEKQLKLPISSKTLWSDSTCVLHWLNSKKQRSVFVENRLREIKTSANISFRYIKTTENPADMATRNTTTCDILKNSHWWKGPPWLILPEVEWPIWKLQPFDPSCNQEERKDNSGKRIFEFSYSKTRSGVSDSKETTALTESSTTSSVDSPLGIDYQKYSSRLKLYRVTAWANRFVNKLKGIQPPDDNLTAYEIIDAKVQWDYYIQHKCFPEIFKAIQVKGKCNLKEQLNIQQDSEGLLRCHGRFLHLDLPDSRRYPKLLPRDDHYTKLVIKEAHHKSLHFGTSFTLSQVRQEYWIPQGRSAVTRVLHQCGVCRRVEGGPYTAPLMPPLPPSRVTRNPPFSYVGIDYLGPVLVKTETNSNPKKVWICLFTCMAIRAIHLELVEDMSTDKFLLCLRRFMAKRGKPIVILSDNAAHFKVAKTIMERVYGKTITSTQVKDYISQSQISWKFITERAPWMGGFYERLVGLVKRALKKSLGKLLLYSDQLRTYLAEIESVINSRPLTYIGQSFDDSRILAPRDFLILNPRAEGDDVRRNTEYLPSSTSAELLSSWKKGKAHLQQFWKVWYNEYLSSLRERSDHRHRQQNNRVNLEPLVDDVVLVKDESSPRGKWTVARISRLYPSQDGQVRSVQLQLSPGKFINRPIKLLYPLEMTREQSKELPTHPKKCHTTERTFDLPQKDGDVIDGTSLDDNFVQVVYPKDDDFPVVDSKSVKKSGEDTLPSPMLHYPDSTDFDDVTSEGSSTKEGSPIKVSIKSKTPTASSTTPPQRSQRKSKIQAIKDLHDLLSRRS